MFWDTISQSRQRLSDPWKQHEQLEKMLIALPPKETVDFSIFFRGFHRNAYRWDLWAVAYIIGGGCSNDGFLDFRAWLVGQGEEFYRKCIASPELVAERATDCI